ncbi:MAG: hypothetical protein P1U89_27350 [Verrucomicrobiales bacterium]|nr:hypothetical protein [Verrucomicrobiales bacterium]
MTLIRPFSIFVVAAFALGVVSCDRGPSPVKGDQLNDFFPKNGDGHTILVTTEKDGFAQASLKAAGVEVATLAITDLIRDQSAAAKFESATEKVDGYPLLPRGNAGTAILVGRFQIQARSKDETFTETERRKWLSKCDLSGLSKLR